MSDISGALRLPIAPPRECGTCHAQPGEPCVYAAGGVHASRLNTGREHFPAAYVDEARGWAMDCEWLDSESLDELPGAAILRGTARHYDGGLAAFADAVR